MWQSRFTFFRKYVKLFANVAVFSVTADSLLLGGHDFVEKNKYLKSLTRLNRRPELVVKFIYVNLFSM